MRKGLTSTAPFQLKPLPDPDISPSQTSRLATCDPEREYGNPLDCPGQIATPQRCVLERPLGTQIGLGWGLQNKRDLVMVKDPPLVVQMTSSTVSLEVV
jgi:hypothetical protein